MYAIVLIPCFLHIYLLTEPQYGQYLYRILCLFALMVAGRFINHEIAAIVLSVAQIAYSAWFCHMYGDLTVIAAINPILNYSQLPNTSSRWGYVLFGFHVLAINFALEGQPMAWAAVCNLFLLTTALLLLLVRQAAMNKQSADDRYDDLRKKHYEMDETRNRLVLFTKQVEGAAQAEERSRISRQLHDDVGHRLVRTKMMMEAALQVMPKDQEKGTELLLQIRDQLSAGLDEMRATVRRMKPAEGASGIHSLSRMLEDVGRETGIKTALTIHGNPYPLYPSQELILYKNAREAITNALKHGHPKSVEVLISYREREICMSVSNDGILPEYMPDQTSGLGLAGMRERCEVAAGKLEIALEPRFTVTTRLPVMVQEQIL